MKAAYGWSISSAPAISCFYVPAGFMFYIVACLRCLWATAELQDSWLRGPSFQMGNFCFLPGTDSFGYLARYSFINIVKTRPSFVLLQYSTASTHFASNWEW